MNGSELIAQERKRQILEKGWTAEDDATLTNDELIYAAHSYLYAKRFREVFQNDSPPLDWPFAEEWWKPTPDDTVRELVKAGALIAAEIDRLQLLNK